MTQRGYTVAEIDRMREVVTWWGFGSNSGPYNPVERMREVEERLRTYMLAGITVEDLEKQYAAPISKPGSL